MSDTKKTALSNKERQAKHREEMAAKGMKSLSLGFVDERYHDALKKLAAQINAGGVSVDLKVREVVTDAREIDLLKQRIETLKGALKLARADHDAALEKIAKKGEEIGRFRRIFWRFWWN